MPKNCSKFVGKRHHVGSLLKRVDEKVIHLISLISRSVCQCVGESRPVNSGLTTVKSNPQVD